MTDEKEREESFDYQQASSNSTYDKNKLNDNLLSELLSIDLFDQDLLLLVLLALLFFKKKNSFAKQINHLNQDLNSLKYYLDTAESTLQALNGIIDLSETE